MKRLIDVCMVLCCTLGFAIPMELSATPASQQANDIQTPIITLGPDHQPLTTPIFKRGSGTTFWTCDGIVSNWFQGFIFDAMALIAKGEGMQMPDQSLCAFSITPANQELPAKYAVDFYLSAEKMFSCIDLDFCQDYRSSAIVVSKDGRGFLSFLLTDAIKGQTVQGCASIEDAKFVAKESCFTYLTR
jgi:hypothetical protein